MSDLTALVKMINDRDAEIARLKADVAFLKDLRGRLIRDLETIAKAWDELYVMCQGGRHSDPECPEDDTCECPGVRLLNLALAVVHEWHEFFRPLTPSEAEAALEEQKDAPDLSDEAIARILKRVKEDR